MNGNAEELEQIATGVLQRFFRQNGRAESADAEGLARRLVELVRTRGAAAGVRDEDVAVLAAHVAGAGAEPLLQDAAKQLVKACLYPELAVCRDSFREVRSDGRCRRQELARVRGRISGTHCVDCPHWVALEPAEHAEMLAREWKAGAAEFAAERAVFLPEDFRTLRRWLARARAAG